ncbi:geranylgeranylglycerol-phosphate geranylgeranyltransferase [Lutimonas sp.]|uniref:geranylgeranylglycerol-phosphate geranylgeranyltransferase n=1 Tax=Lutimonas sp. TaxID=1872403 RepID=UPI003D9BCF60
MILLIQYLFKYFLFEQFDIQVALDDLHFFLLAISTCFIAIAGYIVNDMHDVKADIINKPEKLFVDKKITRMMAQNLFIGFNAIGLITGMYLSYHVGNTNFFIIYLLTSLLLYQYAKYLKKNILVGNIIVSSVVLFCILMVAVFDVGPATNNYNFESQKSVFGIFLVIGVFGFLLTFLREIVKDIEDIEGDKAIQAKSFPIVLGIDKTNTILISVTVFFVASLAYLSYFVFDKSLYLSMYLLLLVCLPLLYFIFKLTKASSKKDYHQLSGLLKIIMLLGMLSIMLV